MMQEIVSVLKLIKAEVGIQSMVPSSYGMYDLSRILDRAIMRLEIAIEVTPPSELPAVIESLSRHPLGPGQQVTPPSEPTTVIENLSRHAFSPDQLAAIRQMFGDAVEIGEAQNPFFTSAAHFAELVNGKTAAAIMPWNYLLDVMADGSLKPGTTILFWEVDEAARKRGNHASRGLMTYRYLGGTGWEKEAISITPTCEVAMQSGEVFKYGGDEPY